MESTCNSYEINVKSNDAKRVDSVCAFNVCCGDTDHKLIECEREYVKKRLENDHKVMLDNETHFSELREDLQRLSFTETSDLFTCRRVSKQWTQISDPILTDTICETLVISRSMMPDETFSDAKQKLILLISMFSDAKCIEFLSPQNSSVCISFDELLHQCKVTMNRVESLCIFDDNCNIDNFYLISECFSQLKCITLHSLDLNDEHISYLFRNLASLERISILNVDISGECFDDIGDFVTSIEWSINSDLVVVKFPFSVNLKDFRLIAPQSFDGQHVLKMLTNNMLNLERLDIICGSLSNFNHLYLDSLEELILTVDTIDGIDTTKQMRSVKSLKLIVTIRTEDVIDLMSKFPNVEIVTLESRCCTLLTSNLSQTFTTLLSLQCLYITDIIETQYDYMIDIDGVQMNVLVSFIEAMHRLQELVFVAKCCRNINSYSKLINECNEIEEKQPQKQSMRIFFVQQTNE